MFHMLITDNDSNNESEKIKRFLKIFGTHTQAISRQTLQHFITTALEEYTISFPLIELYRWVQTTNKRLITKKQLRAFIHRFLTDKNINERVDWPWIPLRKYVIVDFFVELLTTQYRHVTEEDAVQFVKNCAKSYSRVAGLREFRNVFKQFTMYETIEPLMIKMSRDMFGNW